MGRTGWSVGWMLGIASGLGACAANGDEKPFPEATSGRETASSADPVAMQPQQAVPPAPVEQPVPIEQQPKLCGGAADLHCPDGYACIDEPNDACVPHEGGVDCIGQCVPEEPESNPCEDVEGQCFTGVIDRCPEGFAVSTLSCDQDQDDDDDDGGGNGVEATCCAPVDDEPSCEGACGGQSPDGQCWCDDRCARDGDCCVDVDVFCDADEAQPLTPSELRARAAQRLTR